MAISLRLATRRSKLALWQAHSTVTRLAEVAPQVQIELVPIVAAGDRISGNLQTAGGKDLFVNALRDAMARGAADAACHSLKDVGREPAGFTLAAFLPRADARDALIGATLSQLRTMERASIGTSSPRRLAQLAQALPHARLVPMRGNINTRLTKLANGDCDAIVLACAGLDRLDLHEHIVERLDVATFLPAPGQGTIAIECRSNDNATYELIQMVNDANSALCARAERACADTVAGDCHTPLGAYATTSATQKVKLTCHLAYAHNIAGGVANGASPEQVGQQAAQQMLAGGGQQILDIIRHERER